MDKEMRVEPTDSRCREKETEVGDRKVGCYFTF